MSKRAFASTRGASGTIVEGRKHILCADGHGDTRTMMMTFLRINGYQVTTTGSLTDALGAIKKGGFDLVILGGMFTDGLGVDLCKQIRKFDSRTPIIFLSSLAYESDKARGMSAGAQAYLTKPVDLCALEETVAEMTRSVGPAPVAGSVKVALDSSYRRPVQTRL